MQKELDYLDFALSFREGYDLAHLDPERCEEFREGLDEHDVRHQAMGYGMQTYEEEQEAVRLAELEMIDKEQVRHVETKQL